MKLKRESLKKKNSFLNKPCFTVKILLTKFFFCLKHIVYVYLAIWVICLFKDHRQISPSLTNLYERMTWCYLFYSKFFNLSEGRYKYYPFRVCIAYTKKSTYNWGLPSINIFTSVYLVLHPHGIAPILLKFYSWSPGAGFIPVISTKGINQIKKGLKKKTFYSYKKI